MVDSSKYIKLNDSLTQVLNTLNINQKVIDQQTATINDLNSHISVLGIWVGVISFAVPIITGFFIYKTREQYKEDITNLRERMYSLINEKNRETINLAFQKLKSTNEVDKQNAAQFIYNHFDYRLSENELKIIEETYHSSAEFNLKHLLKSILANNPSLVSDKFFRGIFIKEDINSNYFNIFRYIANSGSDFTFEFIKLLEKSESKLANYYGLIYQSVFASVDIAKDFLSNIEIINILKNEPLVQVETYLNSIANIFKEGQYLGMIDIEKTVFYKTMSDLKQDIKTETVSTNILNTYDEQITDIITNTQLKVIGKKVVDKEGNEYESILVSRSLFTGLLQKVENAVEIDGKLITLEEIKNHKKSKK